MTNIKNHKYNIIRFLLKKQPFFEDFLNSLSMLQ
ncbi:hypothetical protein LMOSLCC2376_2212 [Listeria monocytogenes SLCC2376]|nr:hypothetical protein LMOSLCC2376_2212 [Listeria monocytogenes SLCC2376]